MAAHAPAEDLSVGFAPLPPRKVLCFAKKSFSLSYQSHHLISILPVPVALPYEYQYGVSRLTGISRPRSPVRHPAPICLSAEDARETPAPRNTRVRSRPAGSAPAHTFIGAPAPRCSPGSATRELHDASGVLRLVRVVSSEWQAEQRRQR